MKLRVWHIPQVPGEAFHVEVETPDEAVKILRVLAEYDLFQLKHRIKRDYSNAQGLEVLEGGDWMEWETINGDDIRVYADGVEL